MRMSAIFRQIFSRFPKRKSGTGLKKALVPVLFVHHNMSSHQANSLSPTLIASTPPIAQKSLVKNLDFYPCQSVKTGTKHTDNGRSNDSKRRPLAIILNWMLAKRRHVLKFGNFYLDQGFDVLSVSLTPLQLLWPTTGAQVVAENVLKFTLDNPEYESILVHGFSVGGYLYGEMLLKIQDNPAKYGRLRERIVGQVFDSAVDYYNIPTGLPKAITNNRSIQKWLEMYIRYHMRLFQESSTKYYLRSSDVFHHNLIRSPGLFFFSRDDPVGTAEGNMRVANKWEELGSKVYVKCWDSSPHVGHLHHHPQDYMEELAAFLDRIDLLALPLQQSKRASKL